MSVNLLSAMSGQVHNHRFIETAETAWDEAAVIHKQYRYNELLEGFKRPGFVSMPEVRRQILLEHGVAGKSAFQPCCNNGRDILSLKNLGATHCFGFDISTEFINQGKAFAEAGNIECELIQADVFELDNSRDGLFDIGLISLGTMMWMPDLTAFFAIMKRLLRRDGWIFIHELHPLTEIFKFNANKHRIVINGSYFDRTPQRRTTGLDYYSGKTYDATPCYSFRHKVSDVIEAMVQNGLAIETFKECEEDMSSGVFKRSQPVKFPVPRSYTITAISHSGNR